MFLPIWAFSYRVVVVRNQKITFKLKNNIYTYIIIIYNDECLFKKYRPKIINEFLLRKVEK